MRKIFLLLAMSGTLAFTGCTNDDEPQVIENNYYFDAEAIELSNVDFDTTNGFEILYDFGQDLLPSDVVLIYRLSEESTNTADIWEPIPRTINFDNGDQLTYDFNFTRQDVVIYMGSNFNLASAPAFSQNQIFRIVIIPAFNPELDRLNLNDYKAVAERYGITEVNIKKINK